jgi:large subunit ribosomal protein L23
MNAFEIIKRPIITEKSTGLKEKDNKYVFEVAKTANKIQVAQAVEELFKVDVEKVTTMVVAGKLKRLGKYSGYRPDWKKAVVRLKRGQEIRVIEESK